MGSVIDSSSSCELLFFLFLQTAVQADTVQTLVRAVLDSDIDQDPTFSNREINILLLRLKNLPGIHVNEDALKRAMLTKENSVSGVFDLVREFEKENTNIPEEERIFSFD